MFRPVTIIVLIALTAPMIQTAEAASRAKGAGTLRCMSCHGVDGRSGNPTIPNLAGQNANYLMIQLEHFKEGERHNPRMTPIAQSLSQDEMARLASYFSALPLEPVNDR